LAKARECELLAEYAHDRMARYTYRDMAGQWREMADQIKQLAEDFQRLKE